MQKDIFEQKATQKIDHVLAKRAIAWLKKQALADPKSARVYDTGQLLRALFPDKPYDTRNAGYITLLNGLKRAAELGVIERSNPWRDRGALSFRYVGPEVMRAKEAAEAAAKKRKVAAGRAARKLRIKVEISGYRDSVSVSMGADSFLRLAKRAGIA